MQVLDDRVFFWSENIETRYDANTEIFAAATSNRGKTDLPAVQAEYARAPRRRRIASVEPEAIYTIGPSRMRKCRSAQPHYPTPVSGGRQTWADHAMGL